MNRNPLTTIVLVFLIGDAYTLWQAFETRSVPMFTAIAWLQCIVFVALYLKKSPIAGAFLFYSIIPLFPIYFGLKLAGITEPPKTSVVYIVALIIYAVALPLFWKTKRDYERFLAANSPSR